MFLSQATIVNAGLIVASRGTYVAAGMSQASVTHVMSRRCQSGGGKSSWRGATIEYAALKGMR
jgi:hypothetical protein